MQKTNWKKYFDKKNWGEPAKAYFNDKASQSKSEVNIYYNYYISENPERKKEIDYCLENFIKSKKVDKIFLIISNADHEKFKNTSDKIEIIILDQRPTYEFMFDLLDSKTKINDYNIIINSDCYIEEGSYELLKSLKEDESWALTRWDVINQNMDLSFRNSRSSQDCWIVKGKSKKIENINFNLGKPGCDNRISFELKKSGYRVYNPSLDFKVIHYHLSEFRNYSEQDRIKGAYLFLDPLKIRNKFLMKIIKNIVRNTSNCYHRNMGLIGIRLNKMSPKLYRFLKKIF